MRRNWFTRSSLRLKATGTTLAITVLALTIMATAGIVQIHHQIDAEQHRSANLAARGISRAMEIALTACDRKELGHLAKSFLRDENVLFVAIYGEAGQHMAEAFRDRAAWEDFQQGKVDTERCVVGSFRTESSNIPSLAVGDSELAAIKPLGRIFVGLSTRESIRAQIHQSRLMAFAAVAAGLLAAGILFVILGPWIRRLQRLSDASKSISNGDFAGSVADDREDEIGVLARSFDAMCIALRQRDDKLRDFTSTLQDQVKQRTRDLEKALAVAEEASRTKSLFLANMSHELRTPLNGVIGMVELLLNAAPNAQQRRYCDIAKASARSLLDLINDILDFSKIEAGKLEIDATEFDLHQVIESAAQMLGERAEKKKLELICSIGPNLPQHVSGDPVRLRQVIVNLTTNAIKFTEKGEVVVDAAVIEQTPRHTLVRFSVRDTGIGIPLDRLGRLFKSFSQIDASTTRKFGGTGLGLAISQRLVELMGGAIGVESEEGKGSTFWFTMSFAKRPQVNPSRQAALIDLRGLRALVVDDNATSRRAIQAQLMSWTLRADTADGPLQARDFLSAAAIRGETYAFVILDLHLPDDNGLEWAKEFRSAPAALDALLITLSSMSDAPTPRHISDHHIATSLTKPVLPSQLYDALIVAMASKKAVRSTGALPAVEPQASAPLAGVRILLAEDNEVNRMVASELLELAGCACTMVVNGREAVESALAQEFDAILMDCQMPEMDGFEATQKIRDTEAAQSRPARRTIIALTANAIKGDRERCLSAGMDGYLTKPIDPVELIETIRSFLPASRKSASAPAADANPLANPRAEVISLPAADPPVDLDTLQRRCMGNRKLAAKALSKFDENMNQEISALVQSVRQGDAKLAAASAHKMKGAAANVSAESVRRIVAELEGLAKADELAQTESCLEELDREVIRFREYLSIALANLAAPQAQVGSAGDRSRIPN